MKECMHGHAHIHTPIHEDLAAVTDYNVCGRWCTHKLSSGERLSVKKEQFWFSISANLKRKSQEK